MAKKTVTHPPKGFEAEIDNATMMRMDAAAATQARGQQRRLVLSACAVDSQTLVRLAKEDPKAFAEMAGMIDAYQAHAQGLLDFAKSAFDRMATAHEMSEAA